ncbi:hypothetical protein O181_065969 [Austropuccinia psidii MF-1]|uniref:Uncharacterized protein n=1 Tax=Austropuccinia psidii MF-1 TaxID=1389203 RepID=A0A9Q3I526_9BASI|nr:hypothetical protein [Austropuccinia psidii MF-1]
MLENGWNPRIPADTLRKDLIDIYPTASSFKVMLDEVKNHERWSLKKLKDSNVGPFVIVALQGTNAVQVELSGELNPTPLTVPPVEKDEDKNMKKVIKDRRLMVKNQREYLVSYRNPVHDDKWLAESEIPDSDKLLRTFRHERRPQA